MTIRIHPLLVLTTTILLITGCGQPSTETAPVDTPTSAGNPSEQPSGEAATQNFPADWSLPDINKSDAAWKQNLPKPAMLSFEDDKAYFWHLQTSHGPMRFRLFDEAAPMHATSTIYLTRLGFYDNVNFHRIIPGFMAQGGDPIGNGTGGPGYEYDGEFDAGLSHDRPGLLSMANRGPGTDGSQFFITFVPTPFLDGKHTIFGEMVEGMDTLNALQERGSRSGATSELIKIERATIEIEPKEAPAA